MCFSNSNSLQWCCIDLSLSLSLSTLHSNMAIDGSACDLFIPAAVRTTQTISGRPIQSHSRLVHRDLPKRGGARKQPRTHDASPPPGTTPVPGDGRRHDAAAAFLAARRLLRLPPAGGPRTILPSSSLLPSRTSRHPSDAASALGLFSFSRWKTGWPRSRSNNIRSRRRARRRRQRQRQRQRRANPRRHRSRTP